MIAALRCPLCHKPLEPAGSNLRCAAGHSFDVAKQGYVHLGTGKKLPEGDTAQMIEARSAFLAKGHFAPLQTALAATAPAGLIVDLGAGPGHYLAAILEEHENAQGIAFDVSKPALKRAARAHPRAGAVLADTWGELPLADDSVDVLLNIFAPRNGVQMRRVLRPDGLLIVVTPEQDHLIELREELGLLTVDESKQERLSNTLRDFVMDQDNRIRWQMQLSAEDAEQLVAMGPNAFHGRAKSPRNLAVTGSVRLSTWKGRPLPNPRADRDAAQ
ncbi:MAG TPA: hypothetical protein DGG94_20500 [Micromonosporaceae bacterium]|nr:hypothetical protein [Micromonosporaceae bacterium]HCU52144.1 hypothetical protein [Micromonosporaceae bacterium]